MWNAPEKPIPQFYIEQGAYETLLKAIEECVEFDVGERTEVKEALDLLAKGVPRDQGVRLFRKATKEPDPIKRRNDLRHAYEKIIMQRGA